MEKKTVARKFHFEINSLDEFIRFVTLIREEDLDSDKIKGLIDELNKGSQELHQTIEENKE